MRHLKIILISVVLYGYSGFVSSLLGQNNKTWGPWLTLYPKGDNTDTKQVQISFSIPGENPCFAKWASPSTWYRTKNDFNCAGYVEFDIDFSWCDGSQHTEHIRVGTAKPGINEDFGQWINGIQLGEPYNIKFTKFVTQDIKKHFTALYEGWKDKVKKAWELYNAEEVDETPEVGEVMKEWLDEIKDAEERALQLNDLLDSYSKNATNEIEEQLKGFETQPTEFETASNNYKKEIDKLLHKEKDTLKKKIPEHKKGKENQTPYDEESYTSKKKPKTITDDEKLNQALMDKMEKDFENKRKQKDENTQVTNASSNIQTYPSLKESGLNVNKKNNPEVAEKVQGYKQFIVNSLNGHKWHYLAEGTTTIEIKNCKWVGNTFIWTQTKEVLNSGRKPFSSDMSITIDNDGCVAGSTTVYQSGFKTDVNNPSIRLWCIRNQCFTYVVCGSNDKAFLDNLKDAFDYIIAHKNN